MKKKKGISLIVLIITIIVVIILAVTVILTITKNNPIESAKEAVFKEDVRAFQDELNMYISNEYTRLQGQRDIKITALGYDKDGDKDKDSVYTYIPDFKKKYEGKLAIKDDMIVYVGSDAKEKEWLLNSGVYIAKTLTVKYVDQDGNKLKEDESMPLMDNYYSVDVPEIEGYIRFSEKLEGKISQDIEVIAEYYLENDNLAFMGLDASGKETTDEASIVSYEVTGIGECNVSKIAIPREHNGKPVIKIKENAFHGNTTLVSVIIGDNIESVGVTAFNSSKKLEKVSINAKKIERSAFMYSKIKQAIIGRNVENIVGALFSYSNLNKLTILSDKVNINNSVIGAAELLTEIVVNDDNSRYMTENGILFSKDGKKICAYPIGIEFDNKIFSNNVKEIGDYAFQGCEKILNVDVPNTVEKIGNGAFGSCKNMVSANINAKEIGTRVFMYCLKINNAVLGDNIEKAGDALFTYSSLKEVTILSDKVNINNKVIGEAPVTKINTNEDNSKYLSKDGILFSKDGTKIYAYPRSKKFDNSVFSGNVKEIGDYAFWYSLKLITLDIPDNVQNIGNWAFDTCKNLTQVTINSSELGCFAFGNCPNIETVNISKNTKKWSNNIFNANKKISSINYHGTMDEWNNTLGKTSSWKNGNTSIKKIICSDGGITL